MRITVATPEDIADWIKSIQASVDSGYRFKTLWDRDFFVSVKFQFEAWKESEAPGFPLSSKQTDQLFRLYETLAREVVRETQKRGAL